MSYNVPIRREQGGKRLVIGEGGSIVMDGGAIEGPSGLAAPIDDLDLSGTYDGDDADIELAVNSILAALRAAKIIDTAAD